MENQGNSNNFSDITQYPKMNIRNKITERLIAKYNFNDITYKSQVMKDTIAKAQKYAKLDETTVLILGETGTGKELFAHSIHNASPRKRAVCSN